VPGGVERVRSNAFYGCKNLTSVVLEEGVKEIQESAFEGCPELKSITIPRSVTKMGDQNEEYAIPTDIRVTIYAYRYSYAHEYAKRENIRFKALDAEPERIANTIKVKQKYSFKVNKKKAQSFSLKASANGAKLSYHSNTEKVTVNSKGKVTIAKGFKGTAVITVSSERTSKYKPANAKVRVVVK
jgi:urease alpha subunit